MFKEEPTSWTKEGATTSVWRQQGRNGTWVSSLRVSDISTAEVYKGIPGRGNSICKGMGKIRAWLLPGWWWRVERGCFIKGLECHTRKSALYPVGSGKLRAHISPSWSQGYHKRMLNALLRSSYIMSMALPWSSSLEALAKKGNEISSLVILCYY